MAGYPRLASIMGAYPEVGVFRRFGALNAQNLLYLQAELTCLENELRRQEKSDLESGDQERSIYGRDWQTLAEPINSNANQQWKLFLKVREKLNEYNSALIQQSEVSRLDAPNARDFRFLVNWMKNPRMGNVYLLGQDSDIWENPTWEDMITLKARNIEDTVSRFVTDRVIHWYHQVLGWRFKKPTGAGNAVDSVHYSDVKLLRGLKLAVTVIASLLPIVSIVVLCSIVGLKKRLGMIGLFTTMFSMSLGVMTGGKPIEIFAATAAFAAVQVVFVGTASNSSGLNS